MKDKLLRLEDMTIEGLTYHVCILRDESLMITLEDWNRFEYKYYDDLGEYIELKIGRGLHEGAI